MHSSCVALLQETAKYKPVSDPEQVVESAVDPSEGERDNFGRWVTGQILLFCARLPQQLSSWTKCKVWLAEEASSLAHALSSGLQLRLHQILSGNAKTAAQVTELLVELPESRVLCCAGSSSRMCRNSGRLLRQKKSYRRAALEGNPSRANAASSSAQQQLPAFILALAIASTWHGKQ